MLSQTTSIFRAHLKYLGIPLISVILVFGGISVILRLACYESEKFAVHLRVNQLSIDSIASISDSSHDLDRLKTEQLSGLKFKLIQDITLYVSLTLVSIGGVLYGMRITSNRVRKN